MAIGMTVPVPAVQADITPAWLTAALREGGRLREASVAARPVRRGRTWGSGAT